MNVNCVICNVMLDAQVKLQRCTCGISYGLTPYFPYDDEFYRLNKIYKKSKEIQKPKVNRFQRMDGFNG